MVVAVLTFGRFHVVTAATANARSEVYLRRKGALLIFSTILGVVATFDLLTLKSNEFVFVPSCISSVVNSVKFPQAVWKITCSQTFSTGRMIADTRTAHILNAFGGQSNK